MPHKHTRKGEDKSTIDLPPTTIAKPLPVSKSARSNGIFSTEVTAIRKNNKRKRNTDNNDDTPKAFARLMSFKEGKKLPKGLDDGLKQTKKQKRAEAEKLKETDSSKAVAEASKTEVPTIQPGERMSDFAARVDAALPISGLINKGAKGGKDPLGLKVGRTKKEKKMHKMYDEWREQDRKIKEKRVEELEIAQEEEEDDTGNVKWKVDTEVDEQKGRKKGKGKKGKVIGEVDDGDGDDPWAVLKTKRGEGPIKLNDVVQAPPLFKKVPKEIFKIRGARVDVEDVPKASGSLRRREELVEVRRSVVEGYRQMMKDNKEAAKHQR